MGDTNRKILLRRRPQGLVAHDDFEIVDVPMPTIGEGEALMEVKYLGIDATVRSWMSEGEGYMPAVELGDVVRCSGVGTVVESNCAKFPEGGTVTGLSGWQRYAVIRDDGLTNLYPADLDIRAYYGIGYTGLTAYVGMVDVGEVKAGETVVVSAAAGATGSLAAQIAKIHGARVIGVTGTDEKCAWLTGELGLDGAINYRTEDVHRRLKELCPKRVDVFFDNTGGPILDAVLARINMRGRVVLCGAISSYNDAHRPPGPANYLNLISRRAKMVGFLSLDHLDRLQEMDTLLNSWVAEGKLKYRLHEFDGLESAPEALNAMFNGENIGKIVVKL